MFPVNAALISANFPQTHIGRLMFLVVQELAYLTGPNFAHSAMDNNFSFSVSSSVLPCLLDHGTGADGRDADGLTDG